MAEKSKNSDESLKPEVPDGFWANLFFFLEGFRERAGSPLYRTFFISWLVWNWKTVYLLFFANDELGLKKYWIISGCSVDSILDPCYSYPVNPYTYWDNFSFLGHSFHFFLIPAFLTWCALSVIPRIEKWAHARYNEKKFNEARESFGLQNRIRTDKIEYERNKKAALEAELESVETERKLLGEKGMLEGMENAIILAFENMGEWEKFKNSPLYSIFSRVIDAVNLGKDVVEYLNRASVGFENFDSEISDFINQGILIRNGRNYGFTAKGEYLKKRFIEEKNKMGP